MNATLFLVLFASPFALPQKPEPLSLQRPGTGEPVCGLGKNFHRGRREALRAELKEGWVLLRGLAEPRDYVRFSQDRIFWYFTGVESPDASLLFDCKSGKATLFLPPHAEEWEVWNGARWDVGDAWVKELSGVDEIAEAKDLPLRLKELSAAQPVMWITRRAFVSATSCHDSATPYDSRIKKDSLDGRVSREKALEDHLEKDFGFKVKDCTVKIDELRLVKTREEIEAMRRAGRSGALAMAEAIRSTQPGFGEWDLESVMSLIQIREGAIGPAYKAIVGSGPNSLMLHYGDNHRRMLRGDVVLIDYAPEVDHYTSDITRTWPVDGKFTKRQAELYDAVLAAQLAGIAAVKPGATIADVSRACEEVLEARGLGHLQRHGPCHYIGLEVHDAGDYRRPFVPGVAFTVEPGLYEPETSIGIRIEDVVIVTANGCEVVSSLVPKERAAIEKLVDEQGLLDWLEKQR